MITEIKKVIHSKKEIVISFNEKDEMMFSHTGLTQIEILGLLRLNEQMVSVNIIKHLNI